MSYCRWGYTVFIAIGRYIWWITLLISYRVAIFGLRRFFLSGTSLGLFLAFPSLQAMAVMEAHCQKTTTTTTSQKKKRVNDDVVCASWLMFIGDVQWRNEKRSFLPSGDPGWSDGSGRHHRQFVGYHGYHVYALRWSPQAPDSRTKAKSRD